MTEIHFQHTLTEIEDTYEEETWSYTLENDGQGISISGYPFILDNPGMRKTLQAVNLVHQLGNLFFLQALKMNPLDGDYLARY